MTILQDLLDRADRVGARAAANQVIATKAGDGEALSVLARLALEDGDLPAARTYLARVGVKDRTGYEVQLAEAMVQQMTGNADMARLAFAQLTGAFPTRHEAFFALGVSLLERAESADAKRTLGTAARMAPNQFLYRFRHAEACAGAGEVAEALSELSATIELRPDFVPAYLALARLVDATQDNAKAIAVIESARKAIPTDRRLAAELVRLRMGQGVAAALAGLTESPLSLAETLTDGGAHDAALALCDSLDAQGQGSAKVTLVRGLALENASRLEEALEAYAKAIAQDESEWSAASNRGLLLLEIAQTDEQLDEAAANLELAVKRAGKKAAEPLFNLALLQGRREAWKAGIATAKKVIAHPAAGGLKAQAEALVASLQKASKAKPAN